MNLFSLNNKKNFFYSTYRSEFFELLALTHFMTLDSLYTPFLGDSGMTCVDKNSQHL